MADEEQIMIFDTLSDRGLWPLIIMGLGLCVLVLSVLGCALAAEKNRDRRGK